MVVLGFTIGALVPVKLVCIAPRWCIEGVRTNGELSRPDFLLHDCWRCFIWLILSSYTRHLGQWLVLVKIRSLFITRSEPNPLWWIALVWQRMPVSVPVALDALPHHACSFPLCTLHHTCYLTYAVSSHRPTFGRPPWIWHPVRTMWPSSAADTSLRYSNH